MEEKYPHASSARLLIVMKVLCVVSAWWTVSPDGGEWNLTVTAVASAFAGGLLVPYGVACGTAMGAAVIIVSLLFIVKQDPSGLGPPEITIPIQLTIAAIPMAGAAWLGRALRARLSRLR
jgi:peptidoglycan biosynthesis protein MviN/MurJ (putative lipid II flippase)